VGHGKIVFALSLAFAAAVAGPARADCGQDMQKLGQARNSEMQRVEEFAKAAHGKPLDPVGFCAKSDGLVRAQAAMIAYMETNKDWCSFPDEAIANLKAAQAKNVSFHAKACDIAAKIKKMKEQQAQGGGPAAQPLPRGPL
jgi:hypothetical protein